MPLDIASAMLRGGAGFAGAGFAGLGAVCAVSPDYAARPVKIKEQTQAAIRAAGGLDWIRDCANDDLQWARKRFIETYAAWNALEKGQFLLPDGELKTLIAGAAEKLLPGVKQ